MSMTREFPELPGWRFTVQEVSAGCYRAEGRDDQGHQVGAMGTDSEAVLDQCKRYAVDAANPVTSRNP